MPATIEDFDEYFEDMLYGGELWVTPRARELGKAIVLHPPAPLRMRWLVETVNFVTVGSLPGHIRKGYGLSWDPLREAMRRGGAEYSRRVLLPLLPGAVRNVSVAGGRMLPGTAGVGRGSRCGLSGAALGSSRRPELRLAGEGCPARVRSTPFDAAGGDRGVSGTPGRAPDATVTGSGREWRQMHAPPSQPPFHPGARDYPAATRARAAACAASAPSCWPAGAALLQRLLAVAVARGPQPERPPGAARSSVSS